MFAIFIRLVLMKKRIYKPENEQVRLPNDEVHIWNFDLNKYSNQIDEYGINRCGRRYTCIFINVEAENL